MTETTILLSVICLTMIALTALGKGDNRSFDKVLNIFRSIFK